MSHSSHGWFQTGFFCYQGQFYFQSAGKVHQQLSIKLAKKRAEGQEQRRSYGADEKDQHLCQHKGQISSLDCLHRTQYCCRYTKQIYISHITYDNTMFRQKQNTLPSTPTSQTCSPASFLQLLHTGQTELAQNRVSRLKKQRQKVEEVTQVCLSQDRQLQMYRQRVSELQEEVESCRSAGLYLQAYEELKEEFEQLYQKYEQSQHQHQQDLKEQAEKIASLHEQLQESQKNQLRGRDEMALMETYWQDSLTDKDNQYRKLQRELEIVQQRGREEAEQWRNRCRELQNSIEERKAEHRSREKSSRRESKAKDSQIQRMRKVVALHERQCVKERERERLRRREEWEDERQELRDRNEQLELMVASLRKQLTQKIMEGEKLRQVVGKLEVKCQRLQDHVQSISFASATCGRRDRECRCEEEQARGDKLEREVERLQRQLRRHVEDYNRVEAELKRRERAQERRQSSIPSRGVSAHR